MFTPKKTATFTTVYNGSGTFICDLCTELITDETDDKWIEIETDNRKLIFHIGCGEQIMLGTMDIYETLIHKELANA